MAERTASTNPLGNIPLKITVERFYRKLQLVFKDVGAGALWIMWKTLKKALKGIQVLAHLTCILE
jgi:hypothetical protein